MGPTYEEEKLMVVHCSFGGKWPNREENDREVQIQIFLGAFYRFNFYKLLQLGGLFGKCHTSFSSFMDAQR